MKKSLLILLFLALCRPAMVFATQAHGGPEGLYVHQIAHLFFAFSMGLLIYWLRKRRLTVVAGWRLIQFSALLFIFWNLDAMVTHWLEEQSALLQIQRSAAMQIRLITESGLNWVAGVYYLTKLDHLLCVPALLLLMLGLRRLLNTPSSPNIMAIETAPERDVSFDGDSPFIDGPPPCAPKPVVEMVKDGQG